MSEPPSSDAPGLDHRPRPAAVVNPGAPRRERSGIDHPGMSWTAFDRYARYSAIAATINANLAGSGGRALDVGDNSGYLHEFSPALHVTSIDVEVNPKPLQGTQLVLADGSRLPIRDRAADVVVSCDALEHVPPAGRASFIEELVRCSSELVVVAAPYDTPGVGGSEELVARYVAAATHGPQPQLVEHAEHGLPSLEETRRVMEGSGLSVACVGNGNLQDWVLGMLIKHQAAGRGGFAALDMGFDIFYNMSLQARSNVGPFYRHLLIGRRSGPPAPCPAQKVDSDPQLEATPLLAALLAVAPGSTGTLDALADAAAQQGEVALHFMTRMEGLEGGLEHLMARCDGIDAALEALLAARSVSASDGIVRRVAKRLRRT